MRCFSWLLIICYVSFSSADDDDGGYLGHQKKELNAQYGISNIDIDGDSKLDGEVDPATFTGLLTPFHHMMRKGSCPTGRQLVNVQIISRSGPTYPCQKSLKNIVKLQQFIETQMADAPANFKWLLDWVTPFKFKDAGKPFPGLKASVMQRAGNQDKLYDTIFKKADIYTAYFGATDVAKSACEIHAQAVGSKQGQKIKPRAKAETLTPWKGCAKWGKLVLDDKKRIAEFKKLQDKLHEDIACSLTKKFGVPKFPCELVPAVWDMCRFGRSLFDKDTQFCSALETEELLRLEHLDNLQLYMMHGAGNQVNIDLGGLLLTELFQEMKASITEPAADQKRFHVRYGGADLLMHLASALKFWPGKPEPGCRCNITNIVTSRDLPVGSNIAFEVYSNPKRNYKPIKAADDYSEEDMSPMEILVKGIPDCAVVRLLMNNRPVDIPGCKMKLDKFCRMDEFFKLYEKVYNKARNTVCKASDYKNTKIEYEADYHN